MNQSSKIFVTSLLVLFIAVVGLAQGPRNGTSQTGSMPISNSQPAQLPASPPTQPIKAKYEGGIFGYNKRQDGTLTFDDTNQRLVFHNKQGQEYLFIPYAGVMSAFADTQARRPAAATVISSIPAPYLLNLPAAFIKKKYQYLTLQFADPDTHVAGITSFKLANKQLTDSVVNALAERAGLVARGAIFVRRRSTDQVDVSQMERHTIDTSRPINGGLLNGRAVSLPEPVYPREARDSGASGTVNVQVLVDEQGNVVEAQAISGPPALQQAAVDAARQARFTPVTIQGQPVKVRGTISYNFELH
ncbi:MAG TPA: energy transducer TonB [Pyrinomonadaceae bacterium]|nr:energy transducer TonB [Pyrinomonadaceae bacterium]